MELQRRSRLDELETHTSETSKKIHSGTQSLTKPPSFVEFEDSTLVETKVLDNRCAVCSQNLRTSIVLLEDALDTNGTTYERSRLRDFTERLKVRCVSSSVLSNCIST